MEIRFMVRFMILDWITCSYMQPTHRLCPDRRRPATSAGRSDSLRGRSIQWRFSPPTPRLPLVRGRSVAAEQNTTAIQVTVPTFLHVTPKYYYLRLVVPLIVGNHRYDRKYGWYTLKVHPTYSTFQPRGPIRVRSGRAARGAVHAIANPVHDGVE